MSYRVDPRPPQRPETDEPENHAQPAAPPRPEPPKQAATPPRASLGAASLVSGHKPQLSLSYVVGKISSRPAPAPQAAVPERMPAVSDEQKVRAALEDSSKSDFGAARRARPVRGDAQAIKDELYRQSGRALIPAPRPMLPLVARPVRIAGEPGPSPEIRFRADTIYGALEARHDATRAALEASIEHWRTEKKESTSPENRARADENLKTAEAELKRLNVEFAAATQEYRVLLGLSHEAAVKPGGVIDPHASPAKSQLERLQEKFAHYNKSVETLRESGALIQPVAVAYGLGAVLHRGALDDNDYKNLDHIYEIGRLLERRTKGVARLGDTNAPGVEYSRGGEK